MTADTQGVLVLLTGVVAIRLVVTERFLAYVRPGMRLPLLGAGIVLVLVAIATLVRAQMARRLPSERPRSAGAHDDRGPRIALAAGAPPRGHRAHRSRAARGVRRGPGGWGPGRGTGRARGRPVDHVRAAGRPSRRRRRPDDRGVRRAGLFRRQRRARWGPRSACPASRWASRDAPMRSCSPASSSAVVPPTRSRCR